MLYGKGEKMKTLGCCLFIFLFLIFDALANKRIKMSKSLVNSFNFPSNIYNYVIFFYIYPTVYKIIFISLSYSSLCMLMSTEFKFSLQVILILCYKGGNGLEKGKEGRYELERKFCFLSCSVNIYLLCYNVVRALH